MTPPPVPPNKNDENAENVARAESRSGSRAAVPGLSSQRPYPRGVLILVGLAAATITAVGMSSIRGILAPVLLTLVLVICANPLRTWLQKHGLPSGIATFTVIVAVLGLLAGFVVVMIVALGQFVTMLPNYSKQFAEIGAKLSGWLAGLGIDHAQLRAVGKSISPGHIAGLVTGTLGGVFSISGALVIVFTMVVLMPADAVYTPTIMKQLEKRNHDLVAAMADYASSVRRYMVVTAVLGLAQGIADAIALYLMGIPAALLWGILAFLCSFIPNIGYFFAIVPPIVFGFLLGGWPTVVAIVLVYGIINAVIQSIVQPKVVGQAVSLNQTITFFSVLFWAVVIGPIGAILAIPLTLLAKAFLVDANPGAHWWRPILGPTAETRNMLKSDAVAAKQARKRSSRAAKTGP